MKLSPKAQSSLDTVIDKFKQGDLGPIVKVIRLKPPQDAPSRNWSLSNQLLAYLQTNELDCRTFHQWKSVDRTVKKGSTASYIISPLLIKKKGEPENDEEKMVCIGFKSTPVFPASSTEGETLVPGGEPIELPPLINVAQRLGISVKYVPLPATRAGDYRPRSDAIRLGTPDPAVFFHELAHAVHARIEGKLKGGQEATQEIVAEFTAVVLMELYGIQDHTGRAWKYIQHYAADPLQAIMKAMNTIEKVLNVLTTTE